MPTRLGTLDWDAIAAALGERGYAELPQILAPEECRALVALYAGSRFRSRVEMARHGFGEGEYKYFSRPLPRLVASLRRAAYPHLAPIANRWAEALAEPARWPTTLAGMAALCRAHGQTRPTPLLLRYLSGGYNCLHQDLYGEIAFPLQVTVFLSRPGIDHGGGEFLLVENRPRMQARGFVVARGQGEGVVFAVRERPVRGKRGYFRATMRHGVSPLAFGERHALGLIFHDAR
jgi:hypothetical protein